jgi:hypothetical protein
MTGSGPAAVMETPRPSLTTATLFGRVTMADSRVITISLDLPRDEADAFSHLLKRTTYDDCARRSNRVRRYPDGRSELDVMWSAVKLIENQFAEAGFNPR